MAAMQQLDTMQGSQYMLLFMTSDSAPPHAPAVAPSSTAAPDSAVPDALPPPPARIAHAASGGGMQFPRSGGAFSREGEHATTQANKARVAGANGELGASGFLSGWQAGGAGLGGGTGWLAELG